MNSFSHCHGEKTAAKRMQLPLLHLLMQLLHRFPADCWWQEESLWSTCLAFDSMTCDIGKYSRESRRKPQKTPPSSIPLWGWCKLAQVDVCMWLNHFFTHIHEYDNDYSRDPLELLPHNLKQKGILWHPLKILQDSWLIPRILENPTRFWKYLQYFRRNPAIRGLLMAYEKLYQQITNGKC